MENIEGEPLSESDLVFWSRQMSEHNLFLYLGLVDPLLKQQALRLHQQWEEFRTGLTPSVNITNRQLRQVNDLLRVTKEYQVNVLTNLTDCKPNTDVRPAWLGWTYPSFLEHIIKELNYSNARINKNRIPPLHEVCFWNTINHEHALLAAHLNDPSERKLIELAYTIAKSIEEANNPESRMFIQLSIRYARELDQYSKDAKNLLNTNRLRTLIHPVLLTHIIREGIRGLGILNNISLREDITTVSELTRDTCVKVFDDFSTLECNKGDKRPQALNICR